MGIHTISIINIMVLLLLVSFTFAVEPEICYDYDNRQVNAANEFIELVIDLRIGRYTLINKQTRQTALAEVQWKVGALESSDPALQHQWTSGPVISPFGEGRYIRIESTKDGFGTMIWQADLFENQTAVVLRTGFENTTKEPVSVGYITPLDAGEIYPGVNISENLAMLDGNGGGECTQVLRDQHSQRRNYNWELYSRVSNVSRDYYLQCRNNVLVTFGSPEKPCSVVAGGLSYTDYEKFARIWNPLSENRRAWLVRMLGETEPLVCYLDLPNTKVDKSPAGPFLEYVQGSSYVYAITADYPEELKTVAFHPSTVIIEAGGLDPARQYQLGFSWWDEKSGRVQSVYAQPAGGKDE
ncbi:MAG: hypothetical protein JW709_09770, partial [Sedimentisphaerales bacterium]|nr:hypothetical protein [Sedimentisphaerales bacterium]